MARGRLLVVASNPPTTSGSRTTSRADLARSVLGFESVEIANIFSLPSYRSGAINELGVHEEGWDVARRDLSSAVKRANAIVLAYGVTKPSGAAKLHYERQLSWLDTLLARRDLPVWWVGGAPRHPYRWQRYTFREHAGVAFPEALRKALCRKDLGLGATASIEAVEEVLLADFEVAPQLVDEGSPLSRRHTGLDLVSH